MGWIFELIAKLVGVITVLFIIQRLIFSKLSKSKYSIHELPGLKTFSILGDLPILWEKYPEGYPQHMRLQQAVFGLQHLFPNESLVKVAVSVIPYAFLIKADAVRVLLSSNKEITKTRDYKFFESWLGLGLLTSTGEKWKKRRRMLNPSFDFRLITKHQLAINENSHTLVSHLSKQVDKEYIDILHFVSLCTLDIVCETALGYNIGAQNSNNSPYVRSVHHMAKVAVERITNLHHWNDFLFNRSPAGKLYNTSLKIVHNFSRKIIKSRINERLPLSKAPKDNATEDFKVKKRLSFLDLLVDEHFKNPSFSESDIQEEVNTLILGGFDTSAVGLSWCIYLLGHHPDIQERAFEEVFNVVGQDKQAPITDIELKEFKYLERVIKESQRMFPSVPFIGRKLEDDLSICGRMVPKGTNCFVAIGVVHRDPDVFPEPNKFNPDRFTTENSIGRNPYGYIPFSAGPRNCIGQKFALNELKTIMAHFIRNFSWKSLDPLDKVTCAPNMVSTPVPGHRIKIFKRN